MKQNYLNLARQGKNHWWRYCLGVPFILIVWGYASTLPAVSILKLAIFAKILPPEPPHFDFIATSIKHIFSTVAVYLVLKYFHRRNFSTVISVEGKLSIKKLLVTTIVVFLILATPFWFGGIVDSTIISDTFKLEQKSWFPFIILATIIQSAGEEFVYRGYLLQGLSLIYPRPIFTILLSSLAFAYMHYFPSVYVPLEDINQFIFYFAFGVVCAVVTIKDKGIERAIGIHSGWNIFLFLLTGI